MKKARVVINIILVVLICFSGYKIASKLLEYKKADDVYSEIRKIRDSREQVKENGELEKSDKDTSEKEDEKTSVKHNKEDKEEAKKENEISTEENKENTDKNQQQSGGTSEDEQDLDDNVLDLSDINKDYRGWITIENTNIDYPILQARNNEYYLNKDINKNDLPSGSIFLDYRNHGFKDKNTVIYGHYMRNGTMFGQLNEFENKEFFDKNNNIYIETPDGKTLKYKVFSVYTTDLNDNYIKTEFNSDKEYSNFIKRIKDKSLFKSNGSVNEKDKILTLSTCSYEFEGARTVIHAKLIK